MQCRCMTLIRISLKNFRLLLVPYLSLRIKEVKYFEHKTLRVCFQLGLLETNSSIYEDKWNSLNERIF